MQANTVCLACGRFWTICHALIGLRFCVATAVLGTKDSCVNPSSEGPP